MLSSFLRRLFTEMLLLLRFVAIKTTIVMPINAEAVVAAVEVAEVIEEDFKVVLEADAKIYSVAALLPFFDL